MVTAAGNTRKIGEESGRWESLLQNTDQWHDARIASYVSQMGKACVGLTGGQDEAAFKSTNPPSWPKFGVFPGHRWFGAPDRMTILPESNLKGDGKVENKFDQGDALEDKTVETSSGCSRSGATDDLRASQLLNQSSDEEEEALMEPAPEDDEDIVFPVVPLAKGTAAGAALGFGLGLSIALPFFYFLSGVDKTYSWIARF